MDDQKPKTFEVAAALLHAKGMSQGDAILKATATYPDLHANYLNRLREGKSECLSLLMSCVKHGPKPDKFEDAVSIYHAGGMGKAESITEAIRAFPDLHAAYLEKVNNGGSGPL